MPKKKSSQSKSSSRRTLLIARRPVFTRIISAFVLLFVVGGGYYWYDATHAATSPEVRLAMDGGKYCLDDHGQQKGSPGNPAMVDAYTCNGSAAQQWTKGGGLIKVNGQCLDVYRNGTANGTKVDLFPCSGGNNQQWRLSGSEIISASANKCLDAPSFQPNVQLDLWACNGGTNQQWSWTSYNPPASNSCASATKNPSATTAQCWGNYEASKRGWGKGTSNWSSLVNLWNRESGWRWNAANASGAYGIPQALPGSKMSSAGSDWSYDADTQIRWGLGYIKSVYGSPNAAWTFEQKNGYY